jgi:hypothetical protein
VVVVVVVVLLLRLQSSLGSIGPPSLGSSGDVGSPLLWLLLLLQLLKCCCVLRHGPLLLLLLLLPCLDLLLQGLRCSLWYVGWDPLARCLWPGRMLHCLVLLLLRIPCTHPTYHKLSLVHSLLLSVTGHLPQCGCCCCCCC